MLFRTFLYFQTIFLNLPHIVRRRIKWQSAYAEMFFLKGEQYFNFNFKYSIYSMVVRLECMEIVYILYIIKNNKKHILLYIKERHVNVYSLTFFIITSMHLSHAHVWTECLHQDERFFNRKLKENILRRTRLKNICCFFKIYQLLTLQGKTSIFFSKLNEKQISRRY